MPRDFQKMKIATKNNSLVMISRINMTKTFSMEKCGFQRRF